MAMRTSSAAARRDVKYPRHGPFALFFSVWIFSPLLASCIDGRLQWVSVSQSAEVVCFSLLFFLYIHFVMLSFVWFFFCRGYGGTNVFFLLSFVSIRAPCSHTPESSSWKLTWLKSINYNEENPEKKEVLVCIRML